MSTNQSRLLVLFLSCASLNFRCNSQVTIIHPEKEKIALAAKVDLPGVSGRIDHIAFDAENHRAFVAALGNNTVEVVDISAKRVVHTINGLREPQGVIYIPSSKKLVVANGGNGECIFFDGATYKQLGVVSLNKDADNIRYDETSHWVYVGHGNGAIAVIDVNTMKQVVDIPLDQHPESFQLSRGNDRIYVNVPDADEIEVIQLSTKKVIEKWKNSGASSNFPMALDQKNNRLFVGYRDKAKLRMINAQTGKEIVITKSSNDADDLFYSPTDSLVFLSAGGGYVDVFRATANQLVVINHIATVTGARTSLLLLSERKFLLAVPKHGQNSAALWVYNLQ